MRFFILLLPVFLFSFSAQPDKLTVAPKPFPFIIEGEVDGLDGKVLSLIVSANDEENRLRDTVENGKFRFEGSSSFVRLAQLKFEDYFLGSTNEMYGTRELLLEPGKVKVKFEYREQDGYHALREQELLSGPLNIELDDFLGNYIDLTGNGGAMIFGRDSVRQDSMRRLVYPTVRKSTLALIEEKFSSPSLMDIVLFRRFIADDLLSTGIFEPNGLSNEEKEQILNLFTSIDVATANPMDYQAAKSLLGFLSKEEVTFQDIEFKVDDGSLALSDLVRNKNYTILYFWFSGCRYCRIFNKEMKGKYDILEAKGVQIVAVSVDQLEIDWTSAMAEDGVEWISLRAEDVTEVESKYRFNAYPRKFLFNKKMERINVPSGSAEEILEWVNSLD